MVPLEEGEKNDKVSKWQKMVSLQHLKLISSFLLLLRQRWKFLNVYKTYNDLAPDSLPSFIWPHSFALRALEVGTSLVCVEWIQWDVQKANEEENVFVINECQRQLKGLQMTKIEYEMNSTASLVNVGCQWHQWNRAKQSKNKQKLIYYFTRKHDHNSG